MKRVLCMLLCVLLLCSACAPQEIETAFTPLPSPDAPYDAPTDMTNLTREKTVALYRPSRNGQTLQCTYQAVTADETAHLAETVIQALLEAPETADIVSLAEYGKVALVGTQPVTVSGNVCTVNLASSALQMTIRDLYTVCLSISTTLCALPEISFVNILVAGQPVAMDVQNLLPLGALSSVVGEDLSLLWEQLVAKRTSVGGVAAQTPLSSAAVLYFPLEDAQGVTCEVRQLSFSGQDPQQLVYGLLDALSGGALEAANVPEMPDLRSLLLLAPEISTLSSGRRSLTLHFVPDVLQRIAAQGIDPVCFFGALTLTLTSFVPSLEQVVMWVGDATLNSLYSTEYGTWVTSGGVMTRSDFAALETDPVVAWVAEEGRLRRMTLNLPSTVSREPSELLSALLATATFPEGLSGEELLGMALAEDTLLVNLSKQAAEKISQSTLDQRLMAYALTGTLCRRYQVRRVRFFFGGEAVDFLSGKVLWSGVFLPDPLMLP